MEKYDKLYFADLEKGEKIEFPRNLRILKAIETFQKGGKLLDVGIGTGLFLRIAKEHGWKAIGIDISNYSVDNAQKQGFEVYQGELGTKTFEDNSFNVVNMRHSIEHFENPKESLSEAYKILKPGGIICIATPNSYGIHAKVFGKDWPHLSLPYHLHFFSKKSLSKLVESAGFKVMQIRTEELTIYDIFKLFLFRLGIHIKYQNPLKLTILINNLLANIGLGEGIMLIARKNEKD